MTIGHDISYETTHADYTDLVHMAFCSCGRWKSTVEPHMWSVQDQALAHLENVERAKASLSRRTIGLKDAARHYRRMADDVTLDERTRGLWTQLAEEVESRLATKTLNTEDQLPLF